MSNAFFLPIWLCDVLPSVSLLQSGTSRTRRPRRTWRTFSVRLALLHRSSECLCSFLFLNFQYNEHTLGNYYSQFVCIFWKDNRIWVLFLLANEVFLCIANLFLSGVILCHCTNFKILLRKQSSEVRNYCIKNSLWKQC